MPDADSTLLLSGTTVLDLTRNVAGPYTTMALRDLGARIIKVEPPTGDDTREWPPFADGRSVVFTAFNRGKESIALDLHNPDERDVVLELARRADVAIESARPGALQRIGLGRDGLMEANPDLVHVSLTAFGDRGPRAGWPGYDAIVQAYSGIMYMTGEANGPPVRAGAAVIDVGTAVWGIVAVLAGLLQRERRAHGAIIDTTMLGTAVAYVQHHLAAAGLAGAQLRRQGSQQHNAAPYEAIEVGGDLVMVAAPNDRLWRRLCEEIGVTELLDDERFATVANRVANRELMAEIFKTRLADNDPSEVAQRLGNAGVPAARIASPADLLADEQVEALELVRRSEDGYRLATVPLRIGDRPPQPPGRSPALGEHTAAILAELDYAPDQITALTGRRTAEENAS